jgi:hypothetical protein
MDVRTDVFLIQIKADIPVEFPVIKIAGIPFFGTPDLFGRLSVPAKGRYSRRTVDWGKDPVLRPPGRI